MKMKVWTNNNFTGRDVIDSAAIIVAPAYRTPSEVAETLNITLKYHFLPGDAQGEDMVELRTDCMGVRILCGV